MQLHVIFSGFPGTLSAGYMEWSSCIVVQSAGKNLLFDTGGTGRRVHLCPCLEKIGLKPAEIDYLCISHFHSDHIYNFDYFPNAAILMHKQEIAYIEDNLERKSDPWQPLFLYPHIQATGRLQHCSEGDSPIPGTSLIHLPGHTPGSMGLLLEDSAMPTTLLAGDAVKNIAELASGKAPMSLDPDQTARSIKKARALGQRIYPGHDRPLLVESKRITALEAIHEIITVPANVVDKDTPRQLHLVLEPSSLCIAEDV